LQNFRDTQDRLVLIIQSLSKINLLAAQSRKFILALKRTMFIHLKMFILDRDVLLSQVFLILRLHT